MNRRRCRTTGRRRVQCRPLKRRPLFWGRPQWAAPFWPGLGEQTTDQHLRRHRRPWGGGGGQRHRCRMATGCRPQYTRRERTAGGLGRAVVRGAQEHQRAEFPEDRSGRLRSPSPRRRMPSAPEARRNVVLNSGPPPQSKADVPKTPCTTRPLAQRHAAPRRSRRASAPVRTRRADHFCNAPPKRRPEHLNTTQMPDRPGSRIRWPYPPRRRGQRVVTETGAVHPLVLALTPRRAEGPLTRPLCIPLGSVSRYWNAF